MHYKCMSTAMSESNCVTTVRLKNLLLTERMQAGQHLWVVVTVEADAADQELLVYLPDHGAGAAVLTLSHRDGHREGTQEPLNLQARGGGNGIKVKDDPRKHSLRGGRICSARKT